MQIDFFAAALRDRTHGSVGLRGSPTAEGRECSGRQHQMLGRRRSQAALAVDTRFVPLSEGGYLRVIQCSESIV
jgi:hypothetical protein